MLTKIQKYLTIDGKVTLENEDILLSGVLPFCWERRYFSDMGKTALGFGWLHSGNVSDVLLKFLTFINQNFMFFGRLFLGV